MGLPLRGGHTTTDPRLDRIPFHDPRSESFPIRELIRAEQVRKPRSYTWKLGIRLDQGRQGACTGFATTHEAAARPKPVPSLSNEIAQEVYLRAQQLDEWPGESYSGSSVTAAVKVGQERGWYGEYRWASALEDLVLAVGYKGPAILGINWYEAMFNTDPKGFIHAAGEVAGGHAILVGRVNVPERWFELQNSWGADWGTTDRYGVGGVARISFADVERLLGEDGDACVPVVRR